MRRRVALSLAFVAALALLSTRAQADTRTLQNGLTVTPYPATHPSDVYGYYGCLDAMIDPANPTANYGRLLQHGLTGGTNRKILILFRDLERAIGPGQWISSASLKLHTVSGQWTTGNEVKIYRVLVPWRQGSEGANPQPQHWACSWNYRLYSADPAEALAWNTPGASGAGTDRAASATVTTNTSANYNATARTWQVGGLTADVSALYQRHDLAFGWVIEYTNPATAAGQNQFYSSEAQDITLRPELLVTFVANPTPPPRDIDLDVTCISRSPEYYRYDPSGNAYQSQLFHDEWVGIMSNPGLADMQKWPNNGDDVTFTAHVINKGTTTNSGPFGYRWLINGQVVSTGTEPTGLSPGQEGTYSFNWVWDANDYANDADPHCKSKDHRDRVITFEADYANQVTEQSKNNNSLSDYLEAPCMGYYVEQTMYDYFNATQNQIGSYSFEDWLQWVAQVWNESYFEMSRFEGFAEDGAFERVRIQKIEVVPDGTLCGGNHIPGCQTNFLIDGEWGFVPDQSYANKWSKLIEWGLIHECSHQLGLIDLYTMNMEAGTPSTPSRVKVKDGTPYYISRGYYPPFMGLMGGGDTRYNANYEPTGYYAGWDVGAANGSTGYRRGFYGEQIYDLPPVVKLRALAAGGTPIPNAAFKIWQSRGGETPDETTYPTWQPIYQGVADASGVVTLPNVSTMEPDDFTTVTGHTLHDNPWGRIGVVGGNGSLLIKVTGYGQKDYTFLRLPEANQAYWRGQTTECVLDVPMQISPAGNLGPTNIAQGKSATSNAGGSPQYAVDGNLNTRWDPGNAPAGTYLQVSLGAQYDLALVVLVQNGWAGDFFQKFRIETSLTGAFSGEQQVLARESVGWGNTCGTRRDIDPSNEQVLWVTYAGAPTAARYVRITSEAASWTKLAELRIYPALPPDTTPPAQVTDLAAGNAAPSGGALTWTAPGDDGWLGTAATYDIRYSTSLITADNFGSATAVPSPPAPVPGGTMQSYILTGLAPDTRYWAALKACDEANNWSPMSNAVTFRTTTSETCVDFTNLTTPVDSSVASALVSDGTSLYFLRRDTYQFYRSSNNGVNWTSLAGPTSQLGGSHGDWMSGILSYYPALGAAGSIIGRHHNATDNLDKIVRYDIATNTWSWTSVFTVGGNGATIVGDYWYAVWHAGGGNFGGPVVRVALTNLTAIIDQRTVLLNIAGGDPYWFSRAACLTQLGGMIYGIKNDWTTPAGTGDRLYRFDPAAFNPSVWSGTGPADYWNSGLWSQHNTLATDLGQLPWEIGYGSAIVALPADWSCDVGSQGGLFIVAGRWPSDQEGWGPATDSFAIFDVATQTFKTGTLPAVTGSGTSATFHNGAVYIKRGGNPDSPYNTQLWRVTPRPGMVLGDLNCDGVADVADISHFVQALVDPVGYDADHDGSPYPTCDRWRGDLNGDSLVDGADVQMFVNMLLTP